jgi:hypothetical protein
VKEGIRMAREADVTNEMNRRREAQKMGVPVGGGSRR